MAIYTSALRVLVVDDDYLVRWAIGETLTAAGHEVRQVSTGSEAVHAALHEPPFDVILLDTDLPDCDRFETFMRLRALAPDAAIVIMSDGGDPEGVSRALRHGANRLLNKPFDVQALAPLVDYTNRCRPI